MPPKSPSIPDQFFTPRPEFIRDLKVPNSFALLTISGTNCIRLYSFSSTVIATLRRFLEQRAVLQGTREDLTNGMCEFALDGKPWSSPKSLATERFIVDILAAIHHSGYNYLSTIDYGRENDDRLAISFSCPKSMSPSASEAPITHSPGPEASRSTLAEKKLYKTPFAISFPSATVLRVIHPPLHSTPAILQAVRSSWPRGVESEKKIGDNCFEFKFKGYKWFQEDTFAADSLRHILSLLSSLDAHSFTLQASLSLSNRSRVKDLWLFTGPPSPLSDDAEFPNHSSPSLLNSSQSGLKRLAPSPEPTHKRLATDPLPIHDELPGSPLRNAHTRAATIDNLRGGTVARGGTPTPPRSHSPAGNILRKAAPRAQVPVSVHDEDVPDGPEYRAVLPSVIPEGAQNMTGVGATPDVFYTTSPFGSPEAEHHSISAFPRPAVHADRSPHHSPHPSPPKTPSAPHSHSPSPIPTSTGIPLPPQLPHVEETRHEFPSAPDDLNEALLPPNTFRDSAFSSNTEITREIPIKWTGADSEPLSPSQETQSPKPQRLSSAPMLPGGWQPTPIEEERHLGSSETERGPIDIKLDQPRDPEGPLHDVHVASPEITDPSDGQRQSEVALIGMLPQAQTPPALAEADGVKQERPNLREGNGNSSSGWVLVNVEGKPTDPPKPQGDHTKSATDPASLSSHDQSASESPSSPPLAKPTSENASMSPAAKAIVIIDAVDAKKSKQKKDSTQSATQSSSRIRRLFSISRKDSPKSPDESADGSPDGKGSNRIRSRSGLGERLRRMGTPEAVRNEDNRRSFD